MIRSNTPTRSDRSVQTGRRPEIPRLAVIGCGAIAELYHLPALARHRDVLQKAVLVDLDQQRRQMLASQFAIPRHTADYREVLGELDGAIVAVPPAHHHAITTELLARGIHVLCEKPLSESSEEARAMAEAADRSGATLCVNHTRRLFPASRRVRELVANGTLGRLREIHYVEGSEFSWPAASGFHFRAAAHGVLADRGIHVLDLICWWLGDKPELISAENDSFGGPEGAARVLLRHKGCEIEVKVSWLTRLANTFSIRGDSATIEGDVDQFRSLLISDRNGKRRTEKLKCGEDDYIEFGRPMVDNFLAVITRGERPLVPAREVIWPIELMEACYQRSTRFDMPWFLQREAI